MSVIYGNIVKKAKELSKVGSGRFVNNPEIWKLFGHQNNYRKDNTFNIPAKDKGGSISMEVLKTMLSFIDKKIVLDKDINWMKEQLIKSGDNELANYNLNNFRNISSYIYRIFKNEILSNKKNSSPFFYIPVEKTKAVFVSELSEILYLTISEIYENYILNISDYTVEEHYRIDEKIKELFINEVKPKIISQLNNELELNETKEQFSQKLQNLL